MGSGGKLLTFSRPQGFADVFRAAQNLQDPISINIPRGAAEIKRDWRVALLRDGHSLEGACLMRRKQRSGTFDTLIELKTVTPFWPTVSLGMVLGRIPPAIKHRAESALYGDQIIPPKSSSHILQALTETDRNARAHVDRLLSGIETLGSPPSAAQLSALEQKDAVALGLEFAGMDSREVLGDVAPTGAAPFLRELPNSTAYEAAMIRHDYGEFPNWMEEESDHLDIRHFRDPRQAGRYVTVFYADKGPLEAATGTDLIYYRNDADSFVLVQYKRMAPKNRSGEVYRPDKQLDEEISRMLSLGLIDTPAEKVADYRLSGQPFYIKLVDSNLRRPQGRTLCPGMYFSLELFSLLKNDPSVQGERGGVAINWGNAGRYFTNTEFISLVQKSWVGTSGTATTKLATIINDSISAKRGLIVVKDDTDLSLPKLRR